MGLRRQARNAYRAIVEETIDRRTHFFDISKSTAPPAPRSDVLLFYSGVHNIGNYTPVLGIKKMLGFPPDVWNVHRTPVDFEHINRNYRAVIVGGAGLFYHAFQEFWKELDSGCHLPAVMWGLGGCFIDGTSDSLVSKPVVRSVAARCDLINVRDTISAEHYGLSADISPCPTIAWLDGMAATGRHDHVLFSSHTELTSDGERSEIRRMLSKQGLRIRETDNVQRVTFGLDDILERLHRRSQLVVATRLHGAIIAYGLGIPYIAVARDEKLRAFQTEWGGGCLIDDLSDLPDALSSVADIQQPELPLREVYHFGHTVSSWLTTQRWLSRPRPLSSG